MTEGSLIVDSIDFGLEIGKGIMVHAKGSPAQIVAVGAAAGITVLAATTGYLIYKGGGLLYDKLER